MANSNKKLHINKDTVISGSDVTLQDIVDYITSDPLVLDKILSNVYVEIKPSGSQGRGLVSKDPDGNLLSIIRNHGNKNVTVDSVGNILFLGYQNTTGINFQNGKRVYDSNGYETNAVTNEILWYAGANSGYYMTAGHTINLSKNISNCPHGIVLHWQGYDPSTKAVGGYDHNYTFVPKSHVSRYNGQGVSCLLGNSSGIRAKKYVYVSNNKITGNDANSTTGAYMGVTYASNNWVLTEVIAV